MVVAVLGILFVAGAALLSVVTFSTKSLDAARIEREDRDAVDALSDAVAQILADGFLSGDGIPLAIPSNLVMHKPGQPIVPCDQDQASDCVVTLPTNAEVVGVHLVDVTEPIEDQQENHCQFRLMSNLEAALHDYPPNNPYVAVAESLGLDRKKMTLAVDVPEAVKQPSFYGVSYIGAVPFVRPENTVNKVRVTNQFYNDADGDGVLDAIEVKIPLDLLPPDLYRALADRLRASDYSGDPDQLTLTLRVVPHGAMVNLNASHDSLKLVGLGLYDPKSIQPIGAQDDVLDGMLLGAPYLAASNEWMLRNRGVLLPRDVPPTRLMSDLFAELLVPQASNASTFSASLNPSTLADPTTWHWWRYDPVADTETDSSPWRTLMTPVSPADGTYDVAHNLTTVSHDDLLMRGWVHPVTGEEMLSWIKRKDQIDAGNPLKVPYAINRYPVKLEGYPDDPRLGRMKVSIPDLDDSARMPLPRVIETLRNAFTLMLMNRPTFDFNANGDLTDDHPWVEGANAVTVAMLTANMIDYVDRDNDPTPVPVVDTNGLPIADAANQLVAYGFEQQPYITEIYTKVRTSDSSDPSTSTWLVDSANSVFAVELYNPYDSDLVLNGYKLVDLFGEDSAGRPDTPDLVSDVTVDTLKRFDGEVTLNGITVPGGDPATVPLDDPSRFIVICGFGATCPDNGTPLTKKEYGIDPDSVMALERTVKHPNGSDVDIIVDVMQVSDDAVVRRGASAPALGTLSPEPDIGVNPESIGSEYVVSLQRDTTAGFWRFVVPRATKLFDQTEHTPGAANHPNAVNIGEPIYPVHIDIAKTANNGSFTFAFPTTGSMLLLSRMAHIYDATPIDSASSPAGASVISPFNRVSPLLLGKFKDRMGNERERNIVGQYDQIDNGRLPVFDVRPDIDDPREHSVQDPPMMGLVEGNDALPWGQFIFDYFTAIPTFDIGDRLACNQTPMGAPPATIMQNCYDRQYPHVDQDGLRVHGRININVAPWQVLAGLPMVREQRIPTAYQAEISAGLSAARPTQGALGEEMAKNIVAYREGRKSWQGGLVPTSYDEDRDPYGGASNEDVFRPRRGYGFLTVGELLNVRHPNIGVAGMRMDAGAIDPDVSMTETDPQARFEFAVANIVALDEWATTRSHVFTVYGVIRGAHYPLTDPTEGPDANGVNGRTKLRSFREADQKAIRFQTTIDRLPMLFGAKQPVRIGSMIMGGYADERDE